MKPILKIINTILIIFVLISCHQTDPVDAYGNFEDDAIMVSAENNGRLTDLFVQEGQNVKEGQVLAVVDTMPLHLKKNIFLAQNRAIDSKAASTQAQKNILVEKLKALQKDQKRIERMLKNNAATQKQLDDINTQIAVLNNQIRNINLQSRAVLVEKNSVKAQIDQIAYLIEHSLIKSPINGTILETFIKTGELAIPGKPICVIQNLKHLILRAYVTEPQLAQITRNQKVIIQVDYAKTLKEQEGTIIWISDKAEFTPKQIQTVDERKNLVYAIKIKVANPDGIYKIGMPASVILKK